MDILTVVCATIGGAVLGAIIGVLIAKFFLWVIYND